MKNHGGIAGIKFLFGFVLATMLGWGMPVPGFAQTAPDPPRTFLMTPTGVNLLDLAFVHDVTDLKIGSLTFSRSFMSSQPRTFSSTGYFTKSWTHNFDMWAENRLIGGQHSSIVVIGRSVYKFSGWSTDTFNYPENDEVGTTFRTVAGHMVFTDRDGTVYTFSGSSSAQQISSIAYPSGRVVTITNTTGNRPKLISSNDGFAIVLDYSGTTNRVTAACAFDLADTYVSTATTCTGAAVKTAYGYTSYTLSSNTYYNLTSATDVSGSTTTYGYDTTKTDGVLTCILPAGETTCRVANTYTVRLDVNLLVVATQTLADGSVWHFDCSCGTAAMADPDDLNPIEYTTVTDPKSNTTTNLFKAGALYQRYDEKNRLTEFTASGRIIFQVTMPEGNKVSYSYNANLVESGQTFIAPPGSGLSNITTGAKTFPTTCTPALCNQPLTVADGKGNITNFTYDSTHGGVTSAMSPAPSSGAARPLKLYTYVQKYAYVKDSGGSLVSTGTPIWMPDTLTECQTVAGSSTPTCDTSASRLRTTYEYGANGTADNLLVRGMASTDLATSITRRTCFSYDTLGRKVSQTSPRGTASLSVCP